MPRPAGRATYLKFGSKTGKFNPVATFGERYAFSGYLATTTGKERRHANKFNSLRNALCGAWEDGEYSKAEITRKKKAIKKLVPHLSPVRGKIKKWAWGALAQQERMMVAELKEAILEATDGDVLKKKAAGEWKQMALSELWKPISSRQKAKKRGKTHTDGPPRQPWDSN